MKKILAIIVSVIIATIVVDGVASHLRTNNPLVSTMSEEVEAVITNAYMGPYGGRVYVEYDGISLHWEDNSLYETYKDHIGETVRCYLITRTFEDGKINRTLVYNENLITTDEETFNYEQTSSQY